MNNYELRKEARESWYNDNDCSGGFSTDEIYVCGYLAAAVPRENRIEELEKEKCELLGIIQDKDKIINDLRNDWIDLVSNSDNLPEYEQPVEIWLEGCDYPRVAYRESLGGGEWRWWVYWGSGYEIGNKSVVIAWREIEKPNFC